MYELEQINPKIVEKYFKAIGKLMLTKHPLLTLQAVLKNTFSTMLPTQSFYFVKPYIQKALEPLKQQLLSKYKIKKFDSLEEAHKIYHTVFNKFDFQDLDTNERKEIEEIFDLIYDLLEFDTYEEENDILYLYSLSHILILAKKHNEMLTIWEELNKNKPPEANYDIARNTNDTKEKMIAFKLNHINIELANPLLNDENRTFFEYQRDLLIDFTTHSCMTTRSIREIIKLKENYPNDIYVKANVSLSHTLNADRPVEKIDIYRSFFASVFGVYRFTSNINKNSPPQSKLYDLASKFSQLMFPELKQLKKPLVTKAKTRQPIREIGNLNGIPLIAFEDKRLKIIKHQDEIDFTEEYLATIIRYANRYAYLSKS